MKPQLTSVREMEPLNRCVWMDAGVVAFRLCDREFACEHCPFDAALRRTPDHMRSDTSEEERAAQAIWHFPSDRVYAATHLWMQRARDGSVRMGIDAYAARLLHPAKGLQRRVISGDCAKGEGWCELQLDGGRIALTMPVAGRITVWNELVCATPGLVTEDPYGAGWIAEMKPAVPRSLEGLACADVACRRALYDARQLRRAIGFCVMSRECSELPPLEDGFVERARSLVGTDPFVRIASRCLRG